MATPVEIPKLGNTVEECIVASWRKRKGDPVSAGDVVAEIETDKATFEVPSPIDGTLLEIFFEEGALVPVFTNLFVVGEPGESVDAFRPRSPEKNASEPVEIQGPASVTEPRPLGSGPHVNSMSPRARRFAE